MLESLKLDLKKLCNISGSKFYINDSTDLLSIMDYSRLQATFSFSYSS